VTGDLFDALPDAPGEPQPLAEGAWLFPALARADAAALLAAIQTVVDAAPLRHMVTPGGHTMSVAMTNCGPLGWVSDARGYRYAPTDPHTGQPWPVVPDVLRKLSMHAAERAGYPGYEPDACLINRYAPGARMSLHQDKDERDAAAPIVSLSLGLPATFLFGGMTRADRPQRYRLAHGDVVVWGGPSRFVFHGVAPLARGHHPEVGDHRYNVTFRKVT
jgi:alkylated DNA repair protein (DNA oxidative demethylase)